ncbi:hypothetical protein [Streptomyces sp. NBC_00989]|uniref:hypothetical protein n=1 Tax=Streptomyces sp. NBC_00989 TaxID=2903705 RepID=UPI002F90C500|nr:hypothetical protein OG714_54330 [Streptomyces sp. NBC_00989]
MGARQFSSDPLHRVSEYETAGVNAQVQVHAVLAAAGFSTEAADELVCAVEAGAVAGAQRHVVERDGSALPERGEAYGKGWRDGVAAVFSDLAGVADFRYQRRGGAASARRFLAHQARQEASAQPTPARRRTVEGGEASPELVGQVLAICEQHYAAVTATTSETWDTEFSRELVGVALLTVRVAERENYPQALSEYLREKRKRLEQLWLRYGPGGMFAGELVLIDLPVCFLLCERIDSDPMWLGGVWGQEGHEETALERLSDAWLYDTRERDER